MPTFLVAGVPVVIPSPAVAVPPLSPAVVTATTLRP